MAASNGEGSLHEFGEDIAASPVLTKIVQSFGSFSFLIYFYNDRVVDFSLSRERILI